MQANYQNAITEFQRGNTAAALKISLSMLDVDPANVEVNLLLAAIYASKQDYSRVVTHCDRVIVSDPKNERALYNAAVACRMKSDNAKSLQYLLRMLEHHPAHPAALKLGVEIHRASGDHRAALKMMQHENQKSPGLPPELQVELGLCYFNLVDYDNAVTAFNRTPAGDPRLAESCHYLGNIYELRGAYQDALKAYSKTIELRPDSLPTLYNMALVYEKMGLYDKAIQCIRHIMSRERSPFYQSVLVRLLSNIDLSAAGGKYIDTVIELLNENTVDLQSLSSSISLHLIHTVDKLEDAVQFAVTGNYAAFSKLMHESVLDALDGSTLFIAYLSNVLVDSYDFECMLVMLRRCLLDLISRNEPLHIASLDLHSALAIQCSLNGFVYPISDVEKVSLKTLSKAFCINDPGDEEKRKPVIVLCMYQLLYQWAGKECDLDISGAETGLLKKLVKYQYRDTCIERELQCGMSSRADVDDEVSVAVMIMYEHSPYPAWKKLDHPIRMDIRAVIRDISPYADIELDSIKSPTVLVAGCGTGRHAILNAMRIESCGVDAIDLSTASLAYASRAASELNVNNINFMQLDILNVSTLNKHYDIIESVGVLHHMKDPAQGLRSLVNILKPGGLMNIGLYSTLGRRHIISIRESQPDKQAITDDDVRAYRSEIMRNTNQALVENIAGFYDFYSLQECRDLLYHVQEHSFTLPEISKLVADAGLSFVAFGFTDPHVPALYRSKYPEDRAMKSLENWHSLETTHQDIFASMYVFWCQKPR